MAIKEFEVGGVTCLDVEDALGKGTVRLYRDRGGRGAFRLIVMSKHKAGTAGTNPCESIPMTREGLRDLVQALGRLLVEKDT